MNQSQRPPRPNAPKSPAHEPEEYYRLLVEGAKDYAIFMMDLTGRFISWNPGVERILGYTEDEFLGCEFATIFTPEDREQGASDQEIGRARETGKSEDMRWHERKDGTRFWAEGMLRALYDDANVLRGYGKVMKDATPRKSAEDALQVAHEQTRSILESITDAFYTVDAEFNFTYVNHQAERVWGIPREQLIGKHLWTVFPQSVGSESYRMHMSAMQTKQPTHYEAISAVTARWLDVHIYPSDAGLSVYFHDITTRKRADSELRERAERESLLNRVGQAIRSTLDSKTVQARAMAVLGKGIGADRCFYQILDAARDLTWIGQDWHRDHLSTLTGRYRISGFGVPFDEIYSAGTALAIEDLEAPSLLPPLRALHTRYGVRSMVSIPFFEDKKVVAVLAVAMADTPRAWTMTEITLIETVATEVRAAVEASRMAEREHAIAITLQEALRPSVPDESPGLRIDSFYRPAQQESNVGGDFVDVFLLKQDCTALVVGDLSGKGLEAAAQVATVRNMLRCAICLEDTLANAVTKLNALLINQGLLTGFVTIFVGAYDATARTLTYVSCGHEPGLIRRAGTGEVEHLASTGLILGAIEDAVYTERVATLEPGDMLALFTDGLTEAGVSAHEFVGVEGISELLVAFGGDSPDELVTHLITGVQTRAKGILRDDASLLAAIMH